MPIIAENAATKFELPTEGMHVSRLFKIIDLGSHVNRNFGKSERLVSLYFEIPNSQPRDDGTAPFVRVGCTLNLHPKSKLSEYLRTWIGGAGDQFDLEELLGLPAMVNIAHSDDGKYANVVAINPLPVGMDCPEAINEPVSLSLEPENFDRAVFDAQPEGLRKFIAESPQYQALSDTDDDDGPPF